MDASRFESIAKTGQREEQIQDNWTEAKARGNRHRQRQMHRQRLKYKRRHKQMPKAMAKTNAAGHGSTRQHTAGRSLFVDRGPLAYGTCLSWFPGVRIYLN